MHWNGRIDCCFPKPPFFLFPSSNGLILTCLSLLLAGGILRRLVRINDGGNLYRAYDQSLYDNTLRSASALVVDIVVLALSSSVNAFQEFFCV